MRLIPSDPDRPYDLPGLPGAARRPVDIDAATTGFTSLRSLRLYRFLAGSVIDGHAEEDEVFVGVTSGSIEMKVGWEEGAADSVGLYTLQAPTDGASAHFVVYLPPGSVYRLTPHTSAEVAYARATPVSKRAPAAFGAHYPSTRLGVTTLIDEQVHAEKLRLRISRLLPENDPLAFNLLSDADADFEALVHVQGSPAENIATVCSHSSNPRPLRSWDTLAFEPGERAVLHAAPGADILVLTVLAK